MTRFSVLRHLAREAVGHHWHAPSVDFRILADLGCELDAFRGLQGKVEGLRCRVTAAMREVHYIDGPEAREVCRRRLVRKAHVYMNLHRVVEQLFTSGHLMRRATPEEVLCPCDGE